MKREHLEEIARQLTTAEDSIIYFCENVLTHDPHNAVKVRPFPIWKEYLKRTMTIAHTAKQCAFYKSRQMMVTWAMCVECCHTVLFSPGMEVGVLSRKEESAGKLIQRVKFIYDHLPYHWQKFLPEVQFYYGKKHIPNKMVVRHHGEPEAVIQAFAEGEDQSRMEVLSLAYWDEVGFCVPSEVAENTYAGLMPTLSGGGRLLMSSTPPRDPEHFWHKLTHGQYLHQ